MITAQQETQNKQQNGQQKGTQRTIYMYNITSLQLEKMKRATGQSGSMLIKIAVDMLYKASEASPGHLSVSAASVAKKPQPG